MFEVYIIESLVDSTYYIGYSQDALKRLREHNTKKSTYTKTRVPWKLVYVERFETRGDAVRREKFLKKQKNREFYQKLIRNWSN